jgi:shikimate dehydrogenase
VNVTGPHKEKALSIADLVTDRATLIGAANTLIFRKDGRIHADNTDGYGFIQNLRQNAPGWVPESGPAAVLGAGGAARAVIASLLDVGVPCARRRVAAGVRAPPDRCRLDSGRQHAR